jgi:hypothetical protein
MLWFFIFSLTILGVVTICVTRTLLKRIQLEKAECSAKLHDLTKKNDSVINNMNTNLEMTKRSLDNMSSNNANIVQNLAQQNSSKIFESLFASLNNASKSDDDSSNLKKTCKKIMQQDNCMCPPNTNLNALSGIDQNISFECISNNVDQLQKIYNDLKQLVGYEYNLSDVNNLSTVTGKFYQLKHMVEHLVDVDIPLNIKNLVDHLPWNNESEQLPKELLNLTPYTLELIQSQLQWRNPI